MVIRKGIAYITSALVILTLLGWAAISYAVHNILPYSPIRPHRITRTELTQHFPAQLDPGAAGLRYSQLNVTVEDSILLKGWFVFSGTGNAKGTVILLHGIASCKESMINVAAKLSRLGYNCILYDSRAHGESGGLNCTFGYYEKHDVSVFIDSARTRFPSMGPVGIYGASLGAAVAIQAMAIDHRIACGIAVSPFATMREVVYDYWKHLSRLPLPSITNASLKRSEEIAHFSVDSVRPEQAALEIDNPVLVIHGDQDSKISIRYGRRVYQNLRSPGKQWFEVGGAGHNDIESVAGETYLGTLAAFLQTNLITE